MTALRYAGGLPASPAQQADGISGVANGRNWLRAGRDTCLVGRVGDRGLFRAQREASCG